MVWKSNICAAVNDNESSLEEVSPKVMEDKENQQVEQNNSSVTVDARSSENYLQDDVVDM